MADEITLDSVHKALTELGVTVETLNGTQSAYRAERQQWARERAGYQQVLAAHGLNWTPTVENLAGLTVDDAGMVSGSVAYKPTPPPLSEQPRPQQATTTSVKPIRTMEDIEGLSSEEFWSRHSEIMAIDNRR